eukprot:Skav212447  [mRNA]  locus=scaffold1094:254407:259171:- [translate_table: standard]
MARASSRCLQRALLGFLLSCAWLAPRHCWVQPRRSVLGGVAVASAAGVASAEEAPELKSKWPAKECSWGAAIQERVKARPGLTVLDIGTGPFALFALVAARAGAKKVYAVEGNPEAAERARNSIAEQDDVPEGVIEVIEGFSTAVTLPEKVDLVCAEIVGAFATQENIVATMQDAQRRHMKDASNPQNYIPSVVQTWTAPVSYALHPVLAPPKFEKLQGQPLTLNPRDRTLELISDPQAWATWGGLRGPSWPWPGKASKSLSFKISRDRLRSNYDAYYEALTTKEEVKAEDARTLAIQTTKSFSGMALWPRLILDPAGQIVVESRGAQGEHQKSHWPTLLTLMSPTPVPIESDDVLSITETTELSKGDILVPLIYLLDSSVDDEVALDLQGLWLHLPKPSAAGIAQETAAAYRRYGEGTRGQQRTEAHHCRIRSSSSHYPG